MKLILDQKKCISCGSCEAVCPKQFKLVSGKATIVNGKENNKVFEKEMEVSSDIQDAIDSCPVQCIEIKEE